MEIKVTVNGIEFIADLLNNKTAEEFTKMLPLSFEMEELNGNEKCRYLSKKLPAESETVGRIEEGDRMLFGASCLVLFYKSFDTTYSYTRIGKIRNTEGLEKAAGKWDAAVSFKVM